LSNLPVEFLAAIWWQNFHIYTLTDPKKCGQRWTGKMNTATLALVDSKGKLLLPPPPNLILIANKLLYLEFGNVKMA
jgi:hypothetical protein